MNWLLKITEGPMKGAEAALVNGMRVKIGRGSDCDIVVADSALAESAFELDVSETAVTLIAPGGVSRVMNSFEAHGFGTSAFAVGPSEGEWGVIRPAPEPEAAAAEAAGGEAARAADGVGDAGGETASGPGGAEEGRGGENAAAASGGGKRRWGCLAAGFGAVVLLALAGAVCFLYRGSHYDRSFVPEEQDACCRLCRYFGRDFCAGIPRVLSFWKDVAEKRVLRTKARERAVLRELVSAHGLSLGETNGHIRVSGNLKRRGERLAIRALALAEDRGAVFDLSDDESFRGCADALLFTITEGCLKPVAATNRVIELEGFAPFELAVDRVDAALRADVPWVEKILRDRIQVGGTPPPEVAATLFARTGELAGRGEDGERVTPGARAPKSAQNGGRIYRIVDGAEGTSTNGHGRAAGAADGGAGGSATNGRDRVSAVLNTTGGRLFDHPFAGVLTKPYPCIVLPDGHRLVEGAKLGTATIMNIEAERLTLDEDGKTVEVEL